jgi:uncharacterized protein (DUF2141 family)
LRQLIKVLFSVLIIILLTSNCARKGRPSGGLKDSIAPLMVTAKPPYKQLNFSSKKIELSFDEYVTLKNINQQLVISPPLKYLPIITPQSAASKKITIKLTDTLQPNTTYTFNFGNSIQDNNEGNKLESFKYIFSTGNFIDSLKVSGKVSDAFNQKFDKNIKVLLYKIDSTFNDSVIFRKKPNYVTSTLDSTLFTITNVAKGKYQLIALKDNANNYLFNPREDKIAFLPEPIELPKDSILINTLSLFQETKAFKYYLPKQVFNGKIQFGFDGKKENVNIELLSSVPANFKSISRFETNKDTLNFWHSAVENDSLVFKLTNGKSIDTATVFLRKKTIDSLEINSNITSTLDLKDTLTLTSNNPIIEIDTTKVNLIDKDSTVIPFQFIKDQHSNKIRFLFNKKHNDRYSLTLLPNTFSDIYNTKNDSLKYTFKTKAPEDYGSIILTIDKKTPSPIIIELLSENNKTVIRKKVITNSATIDFNLLPPGKYLIRGIIDYNNNNKWDTGNYVNKIQPEKVIYYPEVFNIRANWHINTEVFTIN